MPTIDGDKPTVIVRRTRKMYFGVPVLAGIEGSYAVLDNRWAVTVAHNDMILKGTFREAYYHPECDLALFKIDDGERVELGLVYKGGKVKHAGYPIGFPLAVNEGEFLDDVVSQRTPDCVSSLSSATTFGGMSGGGVYNENNELIGVTVGINSAVSKDGRVHKRVTEFQSLYGVRDWIKKITGKDYWK